jgi:Protein of unknown function (DUF1587)/Planctomycete cytochrome C
MRERERSHKRHKTHISISLIFLSVLLVLFVAASPLSAQQALINQYCITCHNQRAKTAGIMFDTMDLTDVSKNAEIWEKAVRKLRGGMMPPPGARQPDRADVASFVSWLENALDQAAASNPNPGRVALHRLNRAEYANAIEDLLGLRIDAAALLPKDDQANGFDNVANVLKVSPSFLDQYISAARAVTNQAIGNPQPKPLSVVLRAPRGSDQSVHIDGLPLASTNSVSAGSPVVVMFAGSNTSIESSSLLMARRFSKKWSAEKKTSSRSIRNRLLPWRQSTAGSKIFRSA